MALNASKKKYLKAIAHHLKPNVIIGKEGLTEGVKNKINQELDSHELLKIKVLDREMSIKSIAEQLASSLGCTILRIIGKTATLYRYNPKNEKTYFEAAYATQAFFKKRIEYAEN